MSSPSSQPNNNPVVLARHEALQAAGSGINRDQEIAETYNLRPRSITAMRAWFTMDSETILEETKITKSTPSSEKKAKFVQIAAAYDHLISSGRKITASFLTRHAESLETTPAKLETALKRFSECLEKVNTQSKKAKSENNGHYNPLEVVTETFRREAKKAKPNYESLRLASKIHDGYVRHVIGEDAYKKIPFILEREKQGPIYSEELGRIFNWDRKSLEANIKAYLKTGVLISKVDDGYTVYKIHPALKVNLSAKRGLLSASLISEV